MKRGKFFIGLLLFIFFACEKDEHSDYIDSVNNQSFQPTPYFLIIPPHFYSVVPPKIIEENPLTVEGVELGKKLYYETLLSKGGPKNGLSCSSCHLQSNSFTVPNLNVLPHFNLGWCYQFLWEGKVSGTLEDIMLFEVRDFFQTDINNFQNNNEYKQLFKKAYNIDSIDHKHLAYALSQFFRTLISGDSRVDKHVMKELNGINIGGGPFLNKSELRGYELFISQERGDCSHCHGSFYNPLWTDNRYRNNGLDAQPDSGLAKHTKKASDLGKFKTPSVRNLVFTAPYMHDNRFQTLEEVIDFYSTGVVPISTNIDILMFDRGSHQANFTAQEKVDLLAFLKALTDSTFTQNPDFQP